MALAPNLVAQLRRRMMDERASRSAFSFLCNDEAATDCLVAITSAKVFTTNVNNARKAASLSIDLTDTRYNTVKKLVEYLGNSPGYAVRASEDYAADHPSTDLELAGSMSVLGQASDLRHHIFSDEELLEILDSACRRHNVSYNPETVPPNESQFVLMLAEAEGNRRLAGNAAKRRNLETSVDQLLQVASELEKAYRADTMRQQRAIPVAPADEGAVGHGDVIQGQMTRQSLRNGYWAPLSASGGEIAKPFLHEPIPSEVEDTRATVRWDRNHDQHFWSYELWRDTIPDVSRPDGVVYQMNQPTLARETMRRVTTAKLVFRSFGARSTKDNVGWATFVEQTGQTVVVCTDVGDDRALLGNGLFLAPPLEPETTYYYRLYVVSVNNEMVASNVVSVRTKAMRALFDKPPISPVSGGPGTVVTIKGKNLTSGVKLTMGGKACAVTFINATSATFIVPTFNNPSAAGLSYDLILESPNGLRDVYVQGFRYTP